MWVNIDQKRDFKQCVFVNNLIIHILKLIICKTESEIKEAVLTSTLTQSRSHKLLFSLLLAMQPPGEC